MRPTYYAKIFLMIAALVVVVVVIRGMSHEKMDQAFQALGLSPGTTDAPGLESGWRKLGPGDERYNLCKTRVDTIEWPTTARKIQEIKDGMKMRWMAYEPTAREIGYMDVERWFSRHCQIVIHAVDPGQLEGKTPESQVTVKFVDNTSMTFDRFGADEFRSGKIAFRSEDFVEALRELQQLAQMTPANGR